MIHLNEHVVILVDAENAEPKDTGQVLKLAEYYGEVDICRAYGDWESPSLGSWCEKLGHPIESIQVDHVGKNATDHGLLIDAGEILGADTSYHIGNVIIVSGDGDFASACRLIQDRGRRVIVIGNKKQTSKDLRKACNAFYCLKDLKIELQQLEKHHLIPPNEVRAFYHLLYMVFYATKSPFGRGVTVQTASKAQLYWTPLAERDWITLAELDEQLHAVNPGYDKKFGNHSLSEWLHNFKWLVEVEGQKVRRNPTYVRYIRLLDAYNKTRWRFREELLHRWESSGISTDSVSLTQMGQVLRELSPDYETLFGGKKLSTWLKDYPDVFHVSDGMVTTGLYGWHICP
jgi:hypothetical protein